MQEHSDGWIDMKLQKNKDFVAYIPQLDCVWVFYIAGKAEYSSETYDEILSITGTLFDILSGLFIPTTIEYSLLSFPNDVPSKDVFDFRPSSVFRRKVDSKKMFPLKICVKMHSWLRYLQII